MSQKHNKKNGQTTNAAPGAGGGRLLPEESQRVRELIAGRHSKAALQLAKDLFKRCASAESEDLLLRAYQARIDDLLKLGLSVEAKALLELVRERFPAAAARLEEHDRELSAIEGRLERVVAPLRDPSLPAEDRDRIETFLRQRIYDLPALAAVSSLPPEHPLLQAASALAGAIQAVTQGPVDDALLALPEVSRRSPLAPWKALVRAIASYHRREDEQCRKWLLSIADDSVPARLIPSFAAMMGARNSARFSPLEQKLIAAAGDHDAALRSALAALEEAFKTSKQGRILDAMRIALPLMHRANTETRERLRQHIAVRAAMQNLNPSAVHAALGGSPRRDAYYFRLLARALEEQRNAESNAEAAIVWEQFRRQAIKQNWFAADGLEDGVLSLHVAQLVEKIPPHIVKEIREDEKSYRKLGKGGKEELLPSPERLYAHACQADPGFEAFQMWLNSAVRSGPFQFADHVAESWRKARPKDIQPLLYLMESAEKRSAYKKSLTYLQQAEELDRLNPEVRRAKLRLLLSAAIRHLRQGKTHLAQAGIEQIESVPEVRPGEVAALTAALRWCCAVIDLDPADRLRQEASLKRAMGDVATFLLLATLAKAGNLDPKAAPPLLQISSIPAAELLTGAVKACVLGQWAGLPILLPRSLCDPLIAAQKPPHGPLDAAQMLVLGEAAWDSGSAELAYAVSSAGLADGSANARFLFLRARCLPQWASVRHDGCCLAALELARRERDTHLASKILDLLDEELRGRPVSPELLSQILEEEQKFKELPVYQRYREPEYAAQLESSACDCPKCRARRGEPVDAGNPRDDEEDFDQPVPPLPRKIMKSIEKILGMLTPELAQQVMSAIAVGKDPIAAIERVMGKGLPQPAAFSKKEKAAQAPLPVQDSLF